MKILSPLSKVEEVEPLVKAGADEFYCGLVNQCAPLNDRPNNSKFNFSNIGELDRAVKIAKSFNKDVYLAINKPTVQLDLALKQAETAERLGMKGVIVSNLLLMRLITKKKLKLDVCVSCLDPAFNSKSIDFFKKFDVKIIHLPRHLGLRDLEMLSKNSSGIELSVFGFNGMCINIESFCSLHSLKKDYFIPCEHFKTTEILGDYRGSKEEVTKKISSPDVSCGICAFKKLEEIGIRNIKIEGRDFSTNDKVRAVSLAKKSIEFCKKDIDYKEYISHCKKLFVEFFNDACEQEYCYF
jgi:putative protease